MKKVIGFIKKYWVLLIIILAVTLYIVNLFLRGSQSNGTPTPTPNNKVATFGSLTPGTSSTTDVTNTLGRPIETKTVNGEVVSQYKSTNQYRFHEVVFTNDTAKLIKEIVNTNDKINSDFITNTYGVASNILYEQLANSTFNLYVYPANGIAYLGHTDGTVLEIWYFEPTTIDKFITDWGQGYSNTPFTDTNTQ